LTFLVFQFFWVISKEESGSLAPLLQTDIVDYFQIRIFVELLTSKPDAFFFKQIISGENRRGSSRGAAQKPDVAGSELVRTSYQVRGC